jgi:hypothetical protein
VPQVGQSCVFSEFSAGASEKDLQVCHSRE